MYKCRAKRSTAEEIKNLSRRAAIIKTNFRSVLIRGEILSLSPRQLVLSESLDNTMYQY